jgi:hypothetical protein
MYSSSIDDGGYRFVILYQALDEESVSGIKVIWNYHSVPDEFQDEEDES